MSDKVRSKLTYANVTATIAVFIALGGGAYALATAPRNSVVSSSIKNGQVKGVDVKESSLGTVPSANPAAFARVSATGVISSAKGIHAATTPISGDATYCFKGLKFQPRGGQVTIDYNGNSGGERFAEFGVGPVGGCPSGTQAFVWIHDASGSDVPMPFFAVFYR